MEVDPTMMPVLAATAASAGGKWPHSESAGADGGLSSTVRSLLMQERPTLLTQTTPVWWPPRWPASPGAARALARSGARVGERASRGWARMCVSARRGA